MLKRLIREDWPHRIDTRAQYKTFEPIGNITRRATRIRCTCRHVDFSGTSAAKSHRITHARVSLLRAAVLSHETDCSERNTRPTQALQLEACTGGHPVACSDLWRVGGRHAESTAAHTRLSRKTEAEARMHAS